MNTAGRVKILRMLSGYTQEAVAAILGISRPSIVVWESGKNLPSIAYIIRLAGLAGVEPGYISYGSPLISCSAWIPTPPIRSQNLSSYIRDINSLFPALLDENGLNAARYSQLGDGGVMFLLGRESELSCLLLAREPLADCFVGIFDKRNAVEMGSFDRVTVESFGEDELAFVARHGSDFSLNLDGVWNALVKARPGARIKEDTINIFFASFTTVMQQYEIAGDDIMKVSAFFTEKYRNIPPLQNISSGALQAEVRDYLETLGCRKRP